MEIKFDSSFIHSPVNYGGRSELEPTTNDDTLT